MEIGLYMAINVENINTNMSLHTKLANEATWHWCSFIMGYDFSSDTDTAIYRRLDHNVAHQYPQTVGPDIQTWLC
jgi:hypothetical protein